jgi:hypothetical protein
LELRLSQLALLHRWAHLLTQQSSITIDRLPTKENKRAFSVLVCRQQTNGNWPFTFSVCRKQTEVAFFHEFCFPFVETWRSTVDMEMETWKRGDMETL